MRYVYPSFSLKFISLHATHFPFKYGEKLCDNGNIATCRYDLFEHEDRCLENDTLTIVLNLSVLTENEQDVAALEKPREVPPFAQYFDNGMFSDFTIYGRDGLVLKVHKVTFRARQIASGIMKSDPHSRGEFKERICLSREWV